VINLHSKTLNIAEFDLPPDNLTIQYKRLKETTIEDILEITRDYFNTEGPNSRGWR
jgi:hypothetical protein